MSKDASRQDLELKQLEEQVRKLGLEILALKATSPTSVWEGRLMRLLPLVSTSLAVIGFWFGVVQWKRAENASLAQRGQEADNLRLDIRRESVHPLWTKQLDLYMDAADAAATIATTQDDRARQAAEQRFWVLYWGPLAAVEDVGLEALSNSQIESAMVRFGKLLDPQPSDRNSQELERASLAISHAIRNSLAPSFDVSLTKLQGLREAE